MSNASCRTSRYVSTRIGKLGNCRTVCSRSSDLSRCSQSGIRRRGFPRGSSSARAAFILNRAPNSDVEPDFLHHQLLRSGAGESEQRLNRRADAEIRQAQHDTVVGSLHLQVGVVDRFAHALRECHSPRSVDPPAESGMNHDAHGSGFVPELLDDDVLSSGTIPVAARCDAMYFTSEFAVAASQPYSACQSLFVGSLGQLSTQCADAMTEHQ